MGDQVPRPRPRPGIAPPPRLPGAGVLLSLIGVLWLSTFVSPTRGPLFVGAVEIVAAAVAYAAHRRRFAAGLISLAALSFLLGLFLRNAMSAL
ncbi:hypothetical protein [Actinopolymorpha alba]|uniref:hypothetical protein n=1 Tax=Actinopolymorpha alba TaxID=533267 RepID=UPI000367FF56|nr:hypothetical protein [Actinopolymorpha alba]